jgi:hypothetical protein
MPEPYTGPLPTIGHNRGHGVKSISVHCEELYCGHSGEVLLDRLALADDLPIIHIPRHRRFVCMLAAVARSTCVPFGRRHAGPACRSIERQPQA